MQNKDPFFYEIANRFYGRLSINKQSLDNFIIKYGFSLEEVGIYSNFANTLSISRQIPKIYIASSDISYVIRLNFYIKAYLIKNFVKDPPITFISLLAPLYVNYSIQNQIFNELFPFIKYPISLDSAIDIISNNFKELNCLNLSYYTYYNINRNFYKDDINFLTNFLKYYVNPKSLFR